MAINETKWIWKDGDFVAWADAQVHVLCHSLQFGSSAFEGIRCYSTPNGPAIFRLEDHMLRLVNSCKIYRMELKYTVEDLVAACCELVEKNGLDACYLRPMVIRGYGAVGMVPFDSPIEVYLPCWPWGAYLGDEALEKGVDCCVSSWHRVAPNTIPAMAKVAGNYLGGQLIKMEALANGFAEAIALGSDGMLSEGSGQNVFLVLDGTLYTPPVDGSLLPGITRASIITLARDAGITVVERPLPRESLYTADEVFFTGTAAEITPVRSVDKIKVGRGKPGPVTLQLQKKFLDVVKGLAPDAHGWLTHVHAERERADREMNKRFALSVLVVLVLLMGLGYLVHGVLLNSDYGQLASLFRTQADQMQYAWLMPVANLFMATGIVWVYQHGRQDKPFLGQGVRYGLAMAALIPVPKFLVYYVIQPVPPSLVVKQIVFDSICLVITGVVLARINK